MKYLLFLLITFTYTVFAQNIQDKLTIIDKTKLPFEFVFDEDYTRDLLINSLNDNVYIIPRDQDITADTTLYIFNYSMSQKKWDSLLIQFPPNHFVSFSNYSMIAFAISNKYLVVEGRDRMLVFEKKNEKYLFNYAIISTDIYGIEHNDDFCFDGLKIYSDIIYGCKSSTTHPGGFDGYSSFAKAAADSQLVSTAIFKYDLKNRKLGKFTLVYPEPIGAGFLNFVPRNIIDCNGKYFIISDVTKNNIYLYDTDWNLLDKYSPNHKNWVYDKNLPDVKTVKAAYMDHAKSSIGLMNPFTHTTSLIHNVYFQNDSTILVSWSVPTGNKENKYKYYYDTYKIIDGKLKLVSTLSDSQIDKNSNITFEKAGVAAIKLEQAYFVFNDYIFTISNDVPFDIFSKEIQKMSLKEYYKKLDDYFIENDTKSCILLYKFKK